MKPTQKQRIFDRLMPADRKMPGPWVHMAELNRITFAYSQRIGDWKKEGYQHEIKIDADGARWYRFTTVPTTFSMTFSTTFSCGMTSSLPKAPAADAIRSPEPKRGRRVRHLKGQLTMEGLGA